PRRHQPVHLFGVVRVEDVDFLPDEELQRLHEAEIYHVSNAVLRSASMRLKGQAAAPDVRTIVAHGRLLLARAVRAAWQARLLSRDPDGLFSGVLGAKDVEELLASLDRAGEPEPARMPPSPPAAPRLSQLLDSIGCTAIAADV